MAKKNKTVKGHLHSGKAPDGRSAALEALHGLRHGLACQEALARALCAAEMPQVEKNLAGELFYGVCRSHFRLEYILKKFLPKPGSLPAPLLDILKIGLFSLLCQQKIPHYASVSAAVEAVRKNYGRLASVANAFLRNVQRNLPEISEPGWYGKERYKALATFYSIHPCISSIWLKSWGEETAVLLMRRSAARPWSGLLAAPNAPGIVTRPLEAACSLKLGKGYCFAPGRLPENAVEMSNAGHVFFQAPGSWHILDQLGMAAWPEPLWDACAGFGGKTLALLFAGAKVALASDLSSRRLIHLQPLCKRYAMRPPAAVLADAASLSLRWQGNILLDVPCSGLGVLARRPDIAMNISPQKIAGLRDMQTRLLSAAARNLLPARRLAYITCTLNPAENELAIREFLNNSPGFELENEWQTPHDHPWLEGMYGAVLKKN